MESVLWLARTGSPWQELPEEFGGWNTVFKRFRHWAERGMFKAVSGDADMEHAMIDGTIVKVHRHGQGAKGGLAIKPSGARVTSKIVALTDALGNPVAFALLPGQRHDQGSELWRLSTPTGLLRRSTAAGPRASSDRKLLPENQGVSTHRNSIRQKLPSLPPCLFKIINTR